MTGRLSMLLIYPIREDFPENRGIVNKMRFQARTFANLTQRCDTVVNRFGGVVFNGEMKIEHRRRTRVWNTINHYVAFYWHVLGLVGRSKYDVVYFRYPGATPVLLAFLLELKRRNPEVVIVAEVPTYPFRQEMKSPTQRLIVTVDNISHPMLKLCVDRIVTFFGQSSIFGIPCVATKNGIDPASIPRRTPRVAEATVSLRLIGVANLATWHGYDRLIQGIANHRRATGTVVRFDIVGDGPVAGELRRLVAQLGLEDVVEFHGIRTGAELNALFDRADVAIGSLGMHRLSLNEASSLKTREYTARGIPFVIGGPDADFPEGWPYALHVSSDETAIDVAALVPWAWALVGANAEMTALQMRQYAESRLSWAAKLQPVLNEVERVRAERLAARQR